MVKPVTATVSKLNNAIVRGEITSYSVDAVGLYVQLKGRAHRQKFITCAIRPTIFAPPLR